MFRRRAPLGLGGWIGKTAISGPFDEKTAEKAMKRARTKKKVLKSGGATGKGMGRAQRKSPPSPPQKRKPARKPPPALPSEGRAELAERLALKRNIRRSLAERIVETVFQEIEKALVKGNRVEIRGFGSFHVKFYKGYRGSNPKTGAPIQVKPKRRAVFRPSALVKRLLNPPAPARKHKTP